MEKIKVRINEDCVTARENNPISDLKPRWVDFQFIMGPSFFESLLKEWQEAELKLRTFKIEIQFTPGWYPTYNNPDNAGCDEMSEPIFYEAGSVHEAEIINESTIKIL